MVVKIIAEERENLSRGGQSGRSEPEPDSSGQIQTSSCGSATLEQEQAHITVRTWTGINSALAKVDRNLRRSAQVGQVGLDWKTFQVLAL